MAQSQREIAEAWAKYLAPSCGKYRWGRAQRDRYKQPGREAYTMQHAREELANKGLLPKECVDSWSKCDKYLEDDLLPKCEEERKRLADDIESCMNVGGVMPTRLPTASKDGWDYPSGWVTDTGMVCSAKPSSGTRLFGREKSGASELLERLNAARRRGLLAPPQVEEDLTSDTRVAIGLGLGAVLLIGGLWWASRKKGAER